MIKSYHAEFLTATILNWQHLLQDDQYKQIIIDSLAWLVEEKRCAVYAFVIMPNHIHLLWRIMGGLERAQVQAALLSFTAHTFKRYLKQQDAALLAKHFVNAADRSYQFWQGDPMVKECWSEPFFLQKLNYIHFNPCQPHWRLAVVPEDYPWSSAAFYEKNDAACYPWLIHYRT